MNDAQPEGILILQHLYFWATTTTKKSTCINIATNPESSAKHEEPQDMLHSYQKHAPHEDDQANEPQN